MPTGRNATAAAPVAARSTYQGKTYCGTGKKVQIPAASGGIGRTMQKPPENRLSPEARRLRKQQRREQQRAANVGRAQKMRALRLARPQEPRAAPKRKAS